MTTTPASPTAPPATLAGVEFRAPSVPGEDEILTPEAVAFVVELARKFGEMAEATILGGQRVLPARLTAAGFSHEHPTLDAALRFELGRAG